MNLTFVTVDQFKETTSAEHAPKSWEPLFHSSNGSIDKARELLGYHPRYTFLEAIRELLTWLNEQGQDERRIFSTYHHKTHPFKLQEISFVSDGRVS